MIGELEEEVNWRSLLQTLVSLSSDSTLGRLLMCNSVSAASTSLNCLLSRSSDVGVLMGVRAGEEVLQDAALERWFCLDPGKTDGA